MRPRALPALALLLAALAGCSTAPSRPAPPPQPEADSGWKPKPGWAVRRMAVAAANPLATQAGWQVLQAGGNALDAAVAVQMALALVEPQSSGIGGGAFLMLWDGRGLHAWDGRETAPAGADEALFLRPDGQPMAYRDAVVSGRAVGVPGVVRMLEAAHRRSGRLPWAQLMQPALRLAEDGFAVSPRLHALLQADPALRRDARAAAHYYRADGTPHPVGHVLRNPALARLLRDIAAQGSAALHEGAAAADLVARVRGHAEPGTLSLADLSGYTPLRREALCSDWRERWRVCGFPPPSSGHLAIAQTLGILAQRDAPAAWAGGVPGADWLHTYAEVSRLAFADRALYVADPGFVAAPGGDWQTLLAPAYLAQRAALIGPRAMAEAPAGRPQGVDSVFAPAAEQPENGTSHVSVVDAGGGVVAMTTSIEAAFGARLMADGGTGLPGGYLLNNQLTDFDFRPRGADGRPVANRVQPGKRPRSSMSPTLVFDRRSGEVVATLGSPGGPVIIHFTAKTLLGLFEQGLNAQQAVDVPNFGALGGRVLLERGRFPPATLQSLRDRGHRVTETELPSGIQAIERVSADAAGGWYGAADPRREGIVIGE